MVVGADHWNDSSKYYCQMNNPTESFLKATVNARVGWLESCGPTSAVNCLAAMGFEVEFTGPGVYRPQPEEVLMDYFNDPRNHSKLQEVRQLPGDIPGNRVPQYYPLGVKEVFNQDVAFRWGPTFPKVADVVSAGNAVMLCLNSPSHYIAVVAYDPGESVLIYHDSWGARFADGNGGFSRRMSREEFRTNVKTYYLVFGLSG